jgi:AraC-like DNA-binding protein
MRFIDRSYSMPIGIGQIATSAEISRSHLYRLFVQYLKMPPNEYLTHYRLQKAIFFLKEKKLSVGEAAYSAGFSDPLYFSRVFKKHMGFPPSQYIRKIQS